MKKLSLVLCLATICLASSFAMAAFQTPDIRLDTGDPLGASDSNSLQICSSSNGHVYAAWFDYRNDPTGEIFFNRSADFGQTWLSNPTMVATLNPDHRGFNMDCTNNGHVYIAYADCSVSDCTIAFLESANSGTSWNFTGHVENGVITNDPGIDPTPRICSTDNGFIYIAWEDNDRYAFGNTSISDIYYAGWYNYGGNGNGGVILNDWAVDSYNPTISCTENGNVYVVWQVSGGIGLNDLIFNRSSDNGWSWQPSAVKIDEGWGNSDIFSKNISSTEDGHVYIGWSDNRNGDYNPYFNRSTDYGATWQATDTRLNTGDSPGSTYSNLFGFDSTEDGHVYATYTDLRNGGVADCYFNRSTDYGATWQTPDIRIDPGDNPGEHNSGGKIVAGQNGNIYAAIVDDRNGGYDLLFTRSLDYGVTWSSIPERINTGTPIGSGAIVDFVITGDSNGHFYTAWLDERTTLGTYDIYFNYWTATFGMTPTLSETMVVLLGAALAFALFFAVSRKSKALRRSN